MQERDPPGTTGLGDEGEWQKGPSDCGGEKRTERRSEWPHSADR